MNEPEPPGQGAPARVAVLLRGRVVMVASAVVRGGSFPVGLVQMPAGWAVLPRFFCQVLSVPAVPHRGTETFLSTRYPRLRNRAILFVAAFLEFVGYRQFLAFERTVATVQVPFKKGQWARMHRTGIKDRSSSPPADERTPAGV